LHRRRAVNDVSNLLAFNIVILKRLNKKPAALEIICYPFFV